MSPRLPTIGGLELLAGRGAFCPEQRCLFVADLHLGKEATFQRHGIAVPQGGTQATLRRLERMICTRQPRETVILGDLFHARSSLTSEVEASFVGLLRRFAEVKFILVRGNHDRHLGPLSHSWALEIVDPPWLHRGRELVHLPRPASDASRMVMAGHLHPAVRLPSGFELTGKFPCFHHADGCLTLPALGEFTGTALIRRRPGDKAWAVIAEHLVEIPAFRCGGR